MSGSCSVRCWWVVVNVTAFEVDNSFAIAKWVSNFEIFAKKRLAAQVNVAIAFAMLKSGADILAKRYGKVVFDLGYCFAGAVNKAVSTCLCHYCPPAAKGVNSLKLWLYCPIAVAVFVAAFAIFASAGLKIAELSDVYLYIGWLHALTV